MATKKNVNEPAPEQAIENALSNTERFLQENGKTLIIALATNDALSGNLKNIATLLSRKNVYFVPMRQDDPETKPHSLVADFDLIEETLTLALKGKQYAKLFI